jgi:GDPmannose 4,6-dehydratase
MTKSTAFVLVSNYRESYNINASTEIFFNHESPLRPDRFVTKKIIPIECKILNDKSIKLKLRN